MEFLNIMDLVKKDPSLEKFIKFFKGDLKTYGSFESQIAAICDDSL